MKRTMFVSVCVAAAAAAFFTVSCANHSSGGAVSVAEGTSEVRIVEAKFVDADVFADNCVGSCGTQLVPYTAATAAAWESLPAETVFQDGKKYSLALKIYTENTDADIITRICHKRTFENDDEIEDMSCSVFSTVSGIEDDVHYYVGQSRAIDCNRLVVSGGFDITDECYLRDKNGAVSNTVSLTATRIGAYARIEQSGITEDLAAGLENSYGNTCVRTLEQLCTALDRVVPSNAAGDKSIRICIFKGAYNDLQSGALLNALKAHMQPGVLLHIVELNMQAVPAHVFENCTFLESVKVGRPKDYTTGIPCTTVGDSAFRNCSYVNYTGTARGTSVLKFSSVTTVGKNAFEGCTVNELD